jgi:hypothetical protein
MADEVVGSARVRIEPDTTGFESALLSDLRGALDAATDQIERAFRDAATQASDSLSDIGATGFDSATAAAVAAGDEIGSTFSETASGIEASLEGAAAAGDEALSGIGATAGDAIAGSFDAAASSITASAASAAADADAELAAIGTTIPDIEITVTADTAPAEAAISGLGETAAGVDPAVEELTESTTALGAATTGTDEVATKFSDTLGGLANVSTATSSSAVGLGNVIKGIAPSTQGAVIGVGALVGVVGSFVSPAIEAQESAERFTTATGGMEASIRNIDVGSLNGDLGEFARVLGTSDEALQDAGTRIFNLGTAAGLAAPDVARTTEQVLALSIGARALNPALGESGDIANTLAGALARGGRSLNDYGISITSTEIAQRALNDTGKASADLLTQAERLAAGAAIATERYGDSLKEALGGAADSPTIRLSVIRNDFGELVEELGQDVVIPALDALEALVPLGEIIVVTLGTVVGALEPVFQIIGLFGPPLSDLAGLVSDLDSDLIGLAAGLVAAYAGISAFTAGLAVANPILAGFVAGVGLIVAGVSAFNAVFGDDGPSKEFTAGVEAASAAISDASRSVDDSIEVFLKGQAESGDLNAAFLRAAGGAENLSDVIEGTAEVTEGMIGAFLQSNEAQALLNTGFISAADLAESFQNHVKDLEEQIQAASAAQLQLAVDNGEVDQSFLDAGKASGDYTLALQEGRVAADQQALAVLSSGLATGAVSRAQYDAAISATAAADGSENYSAALDLLRETNLQTLEGQEALNEQMLGLAGRLPEVGAAFAGVTDGTGSLSLGLVDLAIQLQGAAVTGADLDTVAAGLGVTTEQLTGFIEGTQAALDAFVQTAVGQIPTLGDAFQSAAAAAAEAERPLSGKDIAAALAENLEAIRNQTANIGELVRAGYGDIAAVAAQQGPEAVAAIAASLRDGDGATLESIRSNLTAIPTAFNELTGQIQTLAPGAIAASGEQALLMTEAFGANYNPQGLVPGVWGAVKESQGLSSLDAIVQAQYIGAQVSGSFGTGVGTDGGMPAIIGGQLAGVTSVVQANTEPLSGVLAGLGTTTTDAYFDNLLLAPKTDSALGSAKGQIEAGKGALVGAAGTTGTATGQALGGDLTTATASSVAKGVVEGSKAIKAIGLILEIQARASGFDVGEALGSGMVSGIDSYVGRISNAAAAAVRSAERAARAEARSQSPSLLFAELGADLGKGVEAGLMASEAGVVTAAEGVVKAAATASATVLRNTSPDVAAAQASLERALKGLAQTQVPGFSSSARVTVPTLLEDGSVQYPGQDTTRGSKAAAEARVILAQRALAEAVASARTTQRAATSSSASRTLQANVVVNINGDVPPDRDLQAIGGRLIDGMAAQFLSDTDLALDLRMVGQQ